MMLKNLLDTAELPFCRNRKVKTLVLNWMVTMMVTMVCLMVAQQGVNAQLTEQQQQSFIEKSHTYSCSVYESTNFVILRFFESDTKLCSECVKSIEILKSNGFHIAAANNFLLFMEK
jgi:hypothetical protein